ncbi:GCN5-related n-acetyl-transferase domain-containing protein [Ditylenchus destructor]|nr:GCN5-related n-acetyl-transferase domain-containing protein [Ditylenchus destructor]
MSAAKCVEHNLKNFAFLIRMADSSNAILEYKKHPKSIIEMYHTEVPQQHRGKGLAEQLVKEAFKYCLENKYKVYPTCTYVAKYSKQFATEEEKSIVVDQLNKSN